MIAGFFSVNSSPFPLNPIVRRRAVTRTEMGRKAAAPVQPPALDAERVAQFEEYVASFRSTFQRTDQFLRFRAYLRGLLEPSDRKNVEAISVAASRVIMVEANLAQALQHFISHSPWDARRLFATVRQHL